MAELPKFRMKKSQIRFMKQWTWFDAMKAKEFSDQGRSEAAGEWARSAAHDVLHAPELQGLIEY